MKFFLNFLSLFLFVGCSHSPHSQDSEKPQNTTPTQRTSCSHNEDTRYLEIKAKDDGSCDLLYTKFGSEKSIARGGSSYCEQVRSQIKTNLTRSGFTCE